MIQIQRSFRSILPPVLVGLQALTLVSCEPIQPILVEKPTLSPESTPSRYESQYNVHYITITTPDSSLTTGQTVQAKAVPRDVYGTAVTAPPVTWAISPTNVATISSTGLITGGSTSGTATVSATTDGVTRSMTVSVTATTTQTSSNPSVHMISITANATTLKIGEVTQVTGVVKDVNGTPLSNVPITWSTAPTSVATIVSTNATTGTLTGKGQGTATVYAKADTVTRSISVTVIDSTTTTTPTPPSGPAPSGGSYGGATAAELPRVTPSAAYPSASRQVRVAAGASLQSAINSAQPGDELLLAPGATYLGNFTLPNKGANNAWIIIRTDLPDATIGSPGTRMTPTRAASAKLAKILSPNIYGTITTNIGAHHYRFTGVEIGAVGGVSDINTLVRFGDDTPLQNSASTTANNLVLDRTYVHGTATQPLKRCLMLNSATAVVVDSWLAECHSNYGDSQAIVGWNGPGPYLIQNNHLEAGSEVIMFGGGGTTIANQSPSDITIRGNHITRPTSWKGKWQVKNLIESKHARRLLIENNVMENTWFDAQAGYAFVLKSENQYNDTPWSQTTDVTIRYNKIRNVGDGFNLAANPSGMPAVPAARFVITDNVMENVNSSPFIGEGRTFLLQGGLADVVMMHNTVVSANGGTAASITFGGLPIVQRLVIHSNVLHYGAYGIKGDNMAPGTASLTRYATGFMFTNNVFLGSAAAASYYPANTYFSSLTSIGFMNLSGGDYRLGAGSPVLGKGFDGRDVGADINQVNARTANVVVGP